MTQINLLDAIKMVQDSFENFTDNQLRNFFVLTEREINERKADKNYFPSIRRGVDKMDEEIKKILDDHEARIKKLENPVKPEKDKE